MSFGSWVSIAREMAASPGWFRRLHWGRERLERHREKQLRKVLDFAYKQIPAYRRLWDQAGVDVSTIDGLSGLTQLPVIDKRFFRSSPIEDFYAPDVLGKVTPRRTSGSTGVSLLFVHSKRNRWKRIMVDLRSNLRLGYRPWQVHLVVASPEAMARGRNVLQKLGLFRREYVSADVDPEVIAKHLTEINPHLLQCYPSHLLLLTDLVDRTKLPRLSRIISAGELLTESQRSRIEDAFGVPVTNYYGLKELGMIAWECSEHRGMHINWDLYHVEQDADSNELIVTLLDDDSMPFVRYNTLDRGRLDSSPCPCGCSFPRILEIEGRSDDCLVTADGKRIPPLRVNFVDFTGHTQADAYQIRQSRPGHIEILLVPTNDFEMGSCEKRIRHDIDRYLSPDLSFEIRLVEAIPRDPSGKLRSVVSTVGRDGTED